MNVAFPPIFGAAAHPVEATRRDVTCGTRDVCPSIFIAELNSIRDAGAFAFWARDAIDVEVPLAVRVKCEVASTLGIDGDLQVVPAPKGRATIVKDLNG